MAESPVVVMPVPIPADEVARTQALAKRYRCDFVDLKNFRKIGRASCRERV